MAARRRKTIVPSRSRTRNSLYGAARQRLCGRTRLEYSLRSFDLDDAVREDAAYLPVLHYQESLDTVSRKLASAAKTAIEESGANMLYLVFGFLEWYESDDSQQAHLAPFVVVPVTIDRTGTRGKAVEFPSYLHRSNYDGTFDSICIRCFQTIASSLAEDRLTPVKIRPH